MKKINVLALALFAVFAFGAIAATSAFAEETELLISGETAKAGELLAAEGELLLSDHKGGPFGEEIMLLCSGLGLGEALSSTDGDVTSSFELGASDPEGAGNVSCTRQSGICPQPVVLTAIDLPWLVVLQLSPTLMGFVGNGGAGAPGYAISCGGIAEDECTNESTAEVRQNANGTILVEFNEANEKAGNCSRGGSGEALLEGTITILSVEEGLAVELMGS